MMIDRGNFARACLQFPSDWERPKFHLGDRVTVDGETGLIVGAFYASSDSCDPEFDSYELGWWFEVVTQTVIPGKVLTNVIGHHQDVIQPELTTIDIEIQRQPESMTFANTLEPLAFGVF